MNKIRNYNLNAKVYAMYVCNVNLIGKALKIPIGMSTLQGFQLVQCFHFLIFKINRSSTTLKVKALVANPAVYLSNCLLLLLLLEMADDLTLICEKLVDHLKEFFEGVL